MRNSPSEVDAPEVHASQQYRKPPAWAVLERKLISALEAAVDVYLAKYTRSDGTLIYAETWPNGRDGLDDLYEAFYNLPMLYLLGGDERFLSLAHHHWEAVNSQASGYGLVKDEYELGYDQFHQSEGNLFFCHLCAADPENPKLIGRARRFADLYLGLPNYDPDKNIIRAFHTGAGGPRWGILDPDGNREIWSRFMEPFGLPFDDLPGIDSFEDLGSWNDSPCHAVNRNAMRNAMNARMGKGDSVANLHATSLVTNAFLMTGDEKYRQWVTTYVSGWWDRARENDGLIPDNVGLEGKVGANLEGRWYGAAYGWTWPLGFDYIDDSVTVAAINATLLTGDTAWLDYPGGLFDHVFAKREVVADYRDEGPPRPEKWIVSAVEATGKTETLVAPKRHKDSGWFAKYPIQAGPLANRWSTTYSAADASRLDELQDAEPQDWIQTHAFRSKGDDGHERPWIEFLNGRNENYPETILNRSLDQVKTRLEAVNSDDADLTGVHIHHWQDHNPITTEALVQLTLGAPQQRYNGGPFCACFRYFDPERDNRPGLPEDVSALVSRVDANGADLTVVNLSEVHQRQIELQGGFYSEHRVLKIVEVSTDRVIAVNGDRFTIHMPPATLIELRVYLERYSNAPKMA